MPPTKLYCLSQIYGPLEAHGTVAGGVGLVLSSVNSIIETESIFNSTNLYLYMGELNVVA